MYRNLLPPDLIPHYSMRMNETRRTRRNQCSNLLKGRGRDDRKIREKEAARKYHSSHETMRKSEGGGFIAPNGQCIFDNSENAVSVDYSTYFIEDKSKEYQEQPEGGGVVSPKNGTTIDINVTTVSDPMSVDNTNDIYVLTRALFDTPKPCSQPAAAFHLLQGILQKPPQNIYFLQVLHYLPI